MAPLGVLSAAACLASVATASELNVPNTFSAGQRANAAQVNQNFDATRQAVNDNNARINSAQSQINALQTSDAAQATQITVLQGQVGVLQTENGTQSALIGATQAEVLGLASQNSSQEQQIDGLEVVVAQQAAQLSTLSAQLTALSQQVGSLPLSQGLRVTSGGTLVGYLVDFLYSFSTALRPASRVRLLSDKGYLFDASLFFSDEQDWLPTGTGLLYESVDCTGTAYYPFIDGFQNEQMPLGQGFVFKFRASISGAQEVRYVPRGATPVSISPQSRREFTGVCNPGGFGDTTAIYATLPNDPAITGVSSTPPAEFPLQFSVP